VKVLAVLMLGLALGCSSASVPTGADGGEAGSCPNDLPNNCPTPVPSYRSDIEPLLGQAGCTFCHSPTGIGGYSEVTYGEVYQQRSAILDQVYGCLMPPASYRPLSTEQRKALLDWLVCGAPNN
jgi:hypothetical protein